MTRKALLLVVAGAFLSGMTAYAHHSFAAEYDSSKPVTIEGTLVQFQFRNPHSFVHVEVPDEKGQVQRWAIEWGGARALAGQGLTRTTLKFGDRVVVTGALSRTPGEHKLALKTLRRTSDGFEWGSTRGQVVD